MAGYDEAVARAALFDRRAERGLVAVGGRDPAAMLSGIVTGRIPESPEERGGGIFAGRGAYSTVLTPKGRIICDLRLVAAPTADEPRFELDLQAAGIESLLGHFERFLPPRFARAADETAETASLVVAGPRAAELLSRELFGLRVEAEELESMVEHEYRAVSGGAGERWTRAVASGELSVPSYEVVGEAAVLSSLARVLVEGGAGVGDPGGFLVLRIEAGRPELGAEIDDSTMPAEVGLDDRAIDHRKGCYTGQEVVVRIRDRGHVNRRLVGLIVEGDGVPAAGTGLFAATGDPGGAREVGRITSAARSPRAGHPLALALLRREIEAGESVAVGDGGSPAVVRAPGPEWWGPPA